MSTKMLRSAARAANLPFCVTGSVPISRENPIKLFFEQPDAGSGNAKSVKFPLSSPEDVNPLLDACKQESFGRGEEEVIDPSYGRALVLHASCFAIAPASAIDPHELGILSKIRQTLLNLTDASAADLDEGVTQISATDRRVVAQLDKLNVYSAGDFFKGHVDTPRSVKKFGTLLINLPVAHEGGQLIVHAGGHRVDEHSFTIEWGSEDVLGWIAFYSDCPHEILPVKSGNRVTLSYSLSFEVTSLHPAVRGDSVQERAAERIVNALKLRGNFDESRPFVAFHLQHAYPVRLHGHEASAVTACLKGGDALIFRALRRIGASITFHYYLPGQDHEICSEQDFVLGENSRLASGSMIGQDIQYELNGRLLRRLGVWTALEAPKVKYKENDKERERVWDERKFTTATKFLYAVCGDNATLGMQYASICMIASAIVRHNSMINRW